MLRQGISLEDSVCGGGDDAAAPTRNDRESRCRLPEAIRRPHPAASTVAAHPDACRGRRKEPLGIGRVDGERPDIAKAVFRRQGLPASSRSITSEKAVTDHPGIQAAWLARIERQSMEVA
jgi:hypothetical protein